MFERYHQKARRVIFFARYEASNYGSRRIETEHILLGLLKEDRPLMSHALGNTGDETSIRKEIEKTITRGERFSTSVEVPLSEESKRVLNLSAEEAAKLGQKHVGTEHILLGILGVESSLAARILKERGAKITAIRDEVSKAAGSWTAVVKTQTGAEAIAMVNGFLDNLRSNNWTGSRFFLAKNVQFIDSTGKRWKGREEIEKQFEALFIPYAKKNVTYLLETADIGPVDYLVASVLWENVILAGETTRSMHRMTVGVRREGEDWVIYLLQVTPVVVR